MPTICVLIPVKSPDAAKTRLSSLLGCEERALLQRAMLEDMICELRHTRLVSAVTLYGPAKGTAVLARRHGISSLPQPPLVNGLNEAVADGTRTLAANGADLILVLPGDLPLIASGDVDSAIDMAMQSDKRVVVPDRWRRGTNGLAFAANRLPDFRFGVDSFPAHLSQGDMQPMFLPSLAFDVDLPDDLHLSDRQWHGCGTRTRAFLAFRHFATQSGCQIQEMTA